MRAKEVRPLPDTRRSAVPGAKFSRPLPNIERTPVGAGHARDFLPGEIF
jgi:hypothetical protein